MNAAHPPHARPRLLLVDDVPTNLRALSDLLPEHYEQQFATSGAEALRLLRQPPLPDLILLDVMMPDMNGYAVLEEIKSWVTTRDIPVIFITALDDATDEVLGLELGAADYITKPFDPGVTLARIRKQLQLRFSRGSAQSSREAAAHSEMVLSGESWIISFQGNPEFHLADRQGLAYLKILLSVPHREFSVEELIFLVVSKERERLIALAADHIEPERLRLLHALGRNITLAFSRRRSAATGAAASASIDDVLGLLSNEALLDRIARIGEEDRDRFRKSIGNAIRRAITEIAAHDPQLADHLRPPVLRMGYRLVYRPETPVVWL